MLKEPRTAPSLFARTMSGAKSGSGSDSPVPQVERAERDTTEAFDVWLQQGLHKLYDSVASEPIPDELLKLIEQDRANRLR